MKRFAKWLKSLFFPPADSSRLKRILPFVILIAFVLLVLVAGTASWEYTNAPSFCGLTCHTMPPEYVTYQHSPHSNLTCEDCHMGRAPIVASIYRKIDYGQGTFFAMLFKTYEYPIRAKKMRPARDACETCHKPEQFSADTVFSLKEFGNDQANTLSSTYLILKTGGGTRRQGLGFGIHWHIENPVYFYALDAERQQIPYVKVQNSDGSSTEYVDVQANFDPSTIKPEQLQKMDCITCHNRTAHAIAQPEDMVNKLMANGLVSTLIPEIHSKAVEVIRGDYASQQIGLDAISGLSQYYQQTYPDFYSANKSLLDQAVQEIQNVYKDSVFIDQKVNWDTHPNNLQHKDSPGCFRCHDGKHLSTSGATVRLECNLCHSVPAVVGPDALEANVPVISGFEPDTHKNTNWISLHRNAFNDSCKGCHTIEDAGGTSNTSFCSNSACHGSVWKYASFDAPKVRAVLAEQLKLMITPTAIPTETPIPTPVRATHQPDELTTVEPAATPTAKGGISIIQPATYEGSIAAVFQNCTGCHGENGKKGVNLTSYQSIMAGSPAGALVDPGNPDGSLIVKAQSAEKPHYGQLSADELKLVIDWIGAGAPEK